MNKVDVKVVVGSNYGDEGKGLATNFFSENSIGKCLNVLYNGGCQRGHTVELKNGKRHVFHHFGSGTFSNAHTYFDKNFMVNPMVFIEEYLQLVNENGKPPICIISPECRVTTPYDMLINQIVEQSRGDKHHGSCGYGIWETSVRTKDMRYNLSFGDLINKTDKEILQWLKYISDDYLYSRLKSYHITTIPQIFEQLIHSAGLAEHYLCDLRSMQHIVPMANFKDIRCGYQSIVFEGAQGLALDENNIAAYPNVTASSTTSQVPIERISDMDADVEICYISRAYFTRHGVGSFNTECEKNSINKTIMDMTNVTNEYQGGLRYGKFDADELLCRVVPDYERSRIILPNIKTSLMLTHLNYNGDIIGNCSANDISSYFDKVYRSYTKFADDIKE